MKRFSLWITERFWVVPAFYSLLAVLLTFIMFQVDTRYAEKLEPYIPGLFRTKVELAKTILSGLSTALLAMTTFTFSTILVVLTTYSSQFSPRTLKNFVRDKMTWRVLGIFMGGFIYSTLSLLLMNEVLSGQAVLAATVGILVSLICLFFFAIFVHHVATNIQVSTLIERLAEDAERVIEEYTSLHEKNKKNSKQIKKQSNEWTYTAQCHGYIQFIHFQKLVSFAQKNNATVEVMVHVGDFIHPEETVLKVHAAEKPEIKVEDCIVAGKEQDTRQDPEFAIQKLVEVSLRAISPGINDPNTAIHNIRQLGRLLGKASFFPDYGGVFYDENDVPRVTYPVRPFGEVLYKAFFQIRHYGKEDISILAAVTDALTITSELASEHAQSDIWDMQLYLIEGMGKDSLLAFDRKFYQHKIDRLAKSTGQPTVKLPPGHPARENDPKQEIIAEQNKAD